MVENKAIYIHNRSLMKRKYKAPGKNGVVNIKTRGGESYSYKYATLDDIINAIDKASKDADVLLDFEQTVKYENNFVFVKTVISATNEDHSEYWSQDFDWLALPTNAQVKEIGGAETYARRYALSAAYGIATEEDKDVIGLEVTQRAPSSYQNNNQGNYSNNKQNVPKKHTEREILEAKVERMIEKAANEYDADSIQVNKWKAMDPNKAFDNITSYVQVFQDMKSGDGPDAIEVTGPVPEGEVADNSNPSDVFEHKVE